MQRYRDWRLERRIKRLGARCKTALDVGDKPHARELWLQMGQAMAQRSPGQVERMEIRAGLRTTIKRRTFAAFCHGLMPAWAVRAVFRMFRLRGL